MKTNDSSHNSSNKSDIDLVELHLNNAAPSELKNSSILSNQDFCYGALPTAKTIPSEWANSLSSQQSVIASISLKQTVDRTEGNRLSKLHGSIKVGDRVYVSGSKEGVVRFIGDADFAKGIWVGVELKEPLGKNDGSVAGKRYFHCPGMHGLFAPVHKVEMHKSSARPCLKKGFRIVSKSNSLSNSFNVGGSQESVNSVGSASSASHRMKLGINSLGGHRSRGSFYNTPTLSALQKTLKEREEHIEQLLRERDVDRTEFIKTAAQIDEVERKLTMIQLDKRRLMDDMNLKVKHAEEVIVALEGEKSDLRMQLTEERRKYEDLQFSLEEVSIEKSEIQGQVEKDSKRLKELEQKLKSVMHLNDELMDEVKSLKMFGVQKEELDDYMDELNHKLCIAEGKSEAKDAKGVSKESHMAADAKTLNNQLKITIQEKLFVEEQRLKLLENFKKVSAEKDLIEMELVNLIEDHTRLLEEKEKLIKEGIKNQKLIHEASIQIKEFERKVERLTCDFTVKMEKFRNRTEAAEADAHSLKSQTLFQLKDQVIKLEKRVQCLVDERDSLVAEVQLLAHIKQERNQVTESRFQLTSESSENILNHNSDGSVHENSTGSIPVTAPLMAKLKSEKDFAESQVDCLNAVIVDLQKRNSDLENQIKIFSEAENIMDPSCNRIGPRLYCDICEIFDQHETEDCPKQIMTSSLLSAPNSAASLVEERPYCAFCEDQCNNGQSH